MEGFHNSCSINQRCDIRDCLYRVLSPANVAESFIDNKRKTSQSSKDSDLASEIAKRIWKQA